MGDIRLHNSTLKNESVGTGPIQIIDMSINELIETEMMESSSIPSIDLLRLLDSISDQLGVTWRGDPLFWDPLDRGIGGAIFITNFWQEIT